MNQMLPKAYSPADAEPLVRAKWESSRAFHAEPGDPGNGDSEPYCILIPPPNVTAPLHLGHALNNTLQDVLIRYHRMRGCNTLWMPGTDHAGIATQTVVEKRLLQEGTSRRELGREKFVATVQAWKDEYEATITEQLKAMGCSCDWARQRFTMDEMCAKAVREAFFRLFKDGLIYRGKRLVNWDPVTQTALADDEVEMQEVQGHMWYLRYPLAEPASAGETEYVTVATTRPETMLGDTAIAMNPKDPRAKDMVGKMVCLPIVGRVIPIIEDDYVVLPRNMGGDPNDPKSEFATGFLKVTPAHDPNDYEIAQRHFDEIATVVAPNAKDDIQRSEHVFFNIFAPDATIRLSGIVEDPSRPSTFVTRSVSEEAKKFEGLSREEARASIVEWFKSHDLLEDVRNYTHSVGHSYRSHVAIEPYLSDQWYVKVTSDRLVGEAQRALADEQFEGAKRKRLAGGAPAAEMGSAGVPPAIHRGVTDALTIHQRRGLPHWQLGGSTYFITFRLKNPHDVLADDERQIVLDACLHWHGQRLHVHLVTVMPDHVHMLMQPLKRDKDVWWSLPDLIHGIKSFTAHEINRKRGTTGKRWQEDYFDRIVRSEHDFIEKWNYTAENPVRAGIVDRAEEYPYTARPENAEGRTSEQVSAGETPALPIREGDSELRFFPARYAKSYQAWHDNLRDWCISRQLWWGHRIPVWFFVNENPDEGEPPLGSSQHAESVEYLVDEYAQSAQVDDQLCVRQSGSDGYFICFSTERARDALLAFGAFADSHKLHRLPRCEEPGRVMKSIPGFEDATAAGSRLMKPFREFRQDPDVLDTWFSSGLWPLSTMGWPDPDAFPDEIPEGDALLETFNPSSVLCTARDIITLWVSRMVMFNRYFNDGRVPFRHVYIHPMIQDGHGQRMSKSLGNGADPRDIIHSHGADAMRFVLVQIATSTQDVRLPVEMVCPHCEHAFHPKEIISPAGYRVAEPRPTCPKCGKNMVSAYGVASGSARPDGDAPPARNSSTRFDLGRNFCNKLWNATRFALSHLQPSPPTPLPGGEGGALSLPDRWIIARLYRTLKKVEHAIAEYQFNVYAEAMYDFIWRDFCDWYLEAIKPTVCDNPAQQQVLRTLLNATLRMLHPICPFVTEALWPHVVESGPAGLDGIELPEQRTERIFEPPLLAMAPWPKIAGSVDNSAAHDQFERVQDFVEAVRAVRGDHNVPDRKRITLYASDDIRAMIEQAGQVVQTLAGLTRVEAIGARPQSAVVFSFSGQEQALGDLSDEIDAHDVKGRLQSEIDELKKRIAGHDARLAKPGYVEKAPSQLVEQTRAELRSFKEELTAKQTSVEALDQVEAR